ncbi:MAG: class I SAM-dependent methyltransferase [Sandaracinaceae bacterium]|nr:class I SAM-dependent methyltransferase [Sandaracinaceae bacterium]
MTARLDALDPGWARFDELVEHWNTRSNLVGAKEPRGRAEILFADAVILEDRELLPEGARIVDVGAGAGAPAIPLLLSRPDLTATLIEPRRLRVAFLRTAIGALELADRCTVLEQKLGTSPPAGAPFDVALSRATFPPAKWLQRAKGLAPLAVVMVAGEPLPDGKRIATRRYELPYSGKPRALGLYRI